VLSVVFIVVFGVVTCLVFFIQPKVES